jgi:hypothetical protein
MTAVSEPSFTCPKCGQEILGWAGRDTDLVTTKIGSVKLKERYMRPSMSGTGAGELCDVVIQGQDGAITFGGDLTQDERRRLCHEIREYIGRYARLEP